MNTKYLQLLRRAPLLVVSLALAAALLVLVGSALAAPRLDSLTRVTSASDTLTRVTSASDTLTHVTSASDTLTRVTSASDSLRGSYDPSLSTDGTIVTFRSDSDFLNEGRADNVFEIWLYDTATMTYTRVTSASHGARDSYHPSLNADGTVVAFHSNSDFLNEGRPAYAYEIWLYDTATMSYTRVTSATGAGDRDSVYPALSSDGTVVAFHGDSDLLNEGRPDSVNEVWLYDTATMTYTRITSATGAGDRNSSAPSLSGDGTIVAFYSDSDLLNEGRPDNVDEIWLYDTATMTYTRVTSATGAGDRDSAGPSLSGDGTVVAFCSDSDFLNEGRPDNVYEIWLYDTATMTYTRVTSASDANRDSYDLSLSADGTVVAFHSDSDLLDEGRPDDVFEIWLYNTATMNYTRVTSASDGLRDSQAPSLSGNGTMVAFHSDSDLLNEGRPDDVMEIWLWEKYHVVVYLPLVLRQ